MGKKLKIKGISIFKPSARSQRHHPYLMQYRESGKRQTLSASTDLQATLEMATAIGKRLERMNLGLVSREEDRWIINSRIPTTTHLDDYMASLLSAGREPKHVNQMHALARNILLGTPADNDKPRRGRGYRVKLDGIGAKYIQQIVPSLVQREIGIVRSKCGAATANRYLESLNGFLNWGIADVRWERNPCAHLRKYNKATDRKHIRRVVSAAEFEKLLASTLAAPRRAGLTGAERCLLYRFVVATGLRRKEVRGLKVMDLLAAGVRVPAALGKNRKSQVIRIGPKLIADLAKEAQGKRPADRLLKCPSNTSRMLRADLKSAGIPYRDERGHVFDFHAVRHETGALMLAGGADVQAVKNHMRHSTIKLTLDTYGHLLGEQVEAALQAVPDFLQPVQQTTCSVIPPLATDLPLGDGQDTVDKVESDWSHGESNPDLLNAIQPVQVTSVTLIRISDNSLEATDDRGKPFRAAPGAAKRAMRKIRHALIVMRKAERKSLVKGGR